MKKEIKGFVCGVVVATIIGAGMASAAGTWESIDVLKNDINIVVNGQPVEVDNFLYNDTTYVPLRAVSSTLGENVDYDETTNTAYIGERVDNTIEPNKDIPKDLLPITIDGVPMVATGRIGGRIIDIEYDDKTGEGVYILDDGTEKRIKCIFTMDRIYIPYDTYVDEIEPLLK